MNVSRYVVEIRAYDTRDQQGPHVAMDVDVSSGSPIVIGVNYRQGDDLSVSALDAWEGLDLRALVALLPKAGRSDLYEVVSGLARGEDFFEEDESVAKVQEAFERAAKHVTEALVGATIEGLAEAIRRDIRSGKFPVGAPLPIRTQLIQMYPGANKYRVQEVTKKLRDEGLLAVGQRRNGVVVLSPRPRPRKAAAARKALNPKEGEAPADDVVLAAFEKYGYSAPAAKELGVSYAVYRDWLTKAQRRRDMADRPIITQPMAA